MIKDRSRGIDEVREIFEALDKQTSVPFVDRFVDKSPLAENRLALLYFFLREQGMEQKRAKSLCVTTGLVQLGLDTHGNVRISYEETLYDERNRQLSVLAGDFYSVYYYHLLAEVEEITAIRVLAEAIQVINEAKMKLYLDENEDKLSTENHMALRMVMDTALYTAVVDHYAATEESRRFWNFLIEKMAAVEYLIGLWEQLQWEKNVPLYLTRLFLQKPGQTIAGVLATVETKVLELIGVWEQLVGSFHPSENQNLFDWITSRYTNRVNRLRRVVEEL